MWPEQHIVDKFSSDNLRDIKIDVYSSNRTGLPINSISVKIKAKTYWIFCKYHVLSHYINGQSRRLYNEKSIKDSYVLMINSDCHAQLTTLKVHSHGRCRQIQSGTDLQTDPNTAARAVPAKQPQQKSWQGARSFIPILLVGFVTHFKFCWGHNYTKTVTIQANPFTSDLLILSSNVLLVDTSTLLRT